MISLVLALMTGASCAAPTPVPELDETLFLNPPLEARASVLWPWLNGYVDREQLTFELEEMRDKGLRGPIIWDIGSLSDPDGIIPHGPPFLESESIASIHHAIDEAGRLGLAIGLVASSSWNAGGAWIDAEHASKALSVWGTAVDGPTEFAHELLLPDEVQPPYADVAVIAVRTESSEDSRHALQRVDLSPLLEESGRLEWSVPEGRWMIMRFVSAGTRQPLVCPSPASDGLVIDHLSGPALDHHFETILSRLRRDDEGFGALDCLMLDSYEVWPRLDWTPGFCERFEEEYGYDPRPYLPFLFGWTADESGLAERFSFDYRQLVSRLLIDNHFARGRRLLNANGLELLAEAGHGGYARVDPLAALGAADVPMGEFWNGSKFWVTKEAASAAHIYGRKFVAAESLTGWRHWQDGPMEHKRLFDLAFCAGLNRPTFHVFEHNPPEAGRPGFAYHAGEHLNVNSTWWPQARGYLDYLGRCSYLLQQGMFVADACVYYGDQAPNLVPSRRLDPNLSPVHADDECQHCGRPKPAEPGLGAGYDYDWISAEVILDHLRVEDGLIVLDSGMVYRLLVLPQRPDISLDVLRKLEDLVAAGAVVVGPRPTRCNSLKDYPACDEEVRQIADRLWGGASGVIADRTPRQVLENLRVPPDFEFTSDQAAADIDYIHRRTEREDLYFVINTAEEPVDIRASFRIDRDTVPRLWDPVSGTVRRVVQYERLDGRIVVPLTLPPVSSIFVVFGPAETEDHAVSVIELLKLDGIDFDGPWQLELPENAGAPRHLNLARLTSWTELEEEGARYFSGTATYRTELSVPDDLIAPENRLTLELGRVEEVATVHLNGDLVGTVWTAPFEVDVTAHLRAGVNELTIEVANLWNNRIVGDLRQEAGEPLARTNIENRFRADMPLKSSGLLGPVHLRVTRQVEVTLD